jgi:hypothetical protein
LEAAMEGNEGGDVEGWKLLVYYYFPSPIDLLPKTFLQTAGIFMHKK